jgi:hypothetical protein
MSVYNGPRRHPADVADDPCILRVIDLGDALRRGETVVLGTLPCVAMFWASAQPADDAWDIQAWDRYKLRWRRLKPAERAAFNDAAETSDTRDEEMAA